MIMDSLAYMQLINDRQLLDEDAQAILMKHVPNWAVEKAEAVLQLVRRYEFPNFMAAMAFANQVAVMAEENNHHPALLIEWGKATVTWWTHSLGGLHKNDFIMAARTDRCYSGQIA